MLKLFNAKVDDMSISRYSHYASEILSLVYNTPGLSRVELAERLGLDKATITNICSELIAKGYIGEELPEDGRRGGRRKIPLLIDDAVGFVLGLEVQPEFISFNAIRPSGEVIATGTELRPVRGNQAPQAIREAIALFLADPRLRAERLLGIGIGMCGIVDPAKGAIVFSRPMAVGEPVAVAEGLKDAFGVPVFTDNDVKCCCYGVMAAEKAGETRDFLYCLCEFVDDDEKPEAFERISLGMAATLGGSVVYGSRGAAGEFRSAFAKSKRAGQFTSWSYPEYLTMKSKPKILAGFFEELAMNIAFIVNFLDLKAVCLGGGIEAYEVEFRAALDKAVAVNWIYQEEMPRQVGIRFETPGTKPVARGAGAIVLRHLFAGPEFEGFGPVGYEYLRAVTEA